MSNPAGQSEVAILLAAARKISSLGLSRKLDLFLKGLGILRVRDYVSDTSKKRLTIRSPMHLEKNRAVVGLG